MKTFGVTYTENWIETQLDYHTAEKHIEVTHKLPFKSDRVTNSRYREIEETGKYYIVSDLSKGGKSFVFELID